MTDEERKQLGEEFEYLLREMGLTNIKDIAPVSYTYKEDCKEVWIIK